MLYLVRYTLGEGSHHRTANNDRAPKLQYVINQTDMHAACLYLAAGRRKGCSNRFQTAMVCSVSCYRRG